MRYLITGHTGFKGAWLTLWLTSQGHEVSGISLDPLPGSLYEVANVAELVSYDLRIDIRDSVGLKNAINQISPDVVLHFAAQPLVRESYKNPRETFETNFMGTYNLLESVSTTESVKAQLIVTTDKVYRNANQLMGFKESDALGGDDPYSASKSAADILTQSWVKSFENCPTAIARAGNVIGGGDVSNDRLFPDLLSSLSKGKVPSLRNPNAVRPWQHVLDCLNGYQLIVDGLFAGKDVGTLNIGPPLSDVVSVAKVTEIVISKMNPGLNWTLDTEDSPSESQVLLLDSNKAKKLLNWSQKLTYRDAIDWTINWHNQVSDGLSPRDISIEQIKNFHHLKMI